MTANQQAALLKLIGHYTGLANDEDAAARMAEITSALNQTYLAWHGPTTKGSPAYFRVTGPTIVIEYSPQGPRPGSSTMDTQHIQWHLSRSYQRLRGQVHKVNKPRRSWLGWTSRRACW
jgi:hypothetical protein